MESEEEEEECAKQAETEREKEDEGRENEDEAEGERGEKVSSRENDSSSLRHSSPLFLQQQQQWLVNAFVVYAWSKRNSLMVDR